VLAQKIAQIERVQCTNVKSKYGNNMIKDKKTFRRLLRKHWKTL